MSIMYITAEETCQDDDKGQLIDIVKSEDHPVDGGSGSGFWIKVENDADDGNIEDQKDWVEVKIEPYELTTADVIPMSSVCTESPEHSVSALCDELEPKPPKRIKTEEEKSDQPRVDCCENECFPPREKFLPSELITQLVAIHPMPERDATVLLENFIDELLKWLSSTPQYLKLQMYQLRVEVAKLALSLGVPGFTPDDKWFSNFKDLFLHRFASYQQRYEKCEDEFLGQLVKWYHEESSQRKVSPGQLERAANDIGGKMGKEPCYLSKDEMRLFVEKQGLYRNINGKVSRIMKVNGGLLQNLFDFEFEVWYHDWPVSSNEVLQNIRHLGEKNWTVFKSYVAISSEWLAQVAWLFCSVSSTLQIKDIDYTEKQIALAVYGSDVQVDYLTFYEAFSAMLQKEIRVIQSFNNKFGERYCYRSYSLCSDHLKKNAEELALIMGYPDVLITRDWLRRFSELTVVCSLSSNRYHKHPRDVNNYFPFDGHEFDVAFINWYHDGCPRDVAAHSCIAGGSMEPHILQVNPKCLNNNYLAFICEIGKWYKEQSVKCFIKSYELKEMADEISQLMGLTSFSPTKEWMKRFTMLKGLKYYHESKGIMVSQGKKALDPEFEELFEAWYSDCTCLKCARRDVGPNPQSFLPKLREKGGPRKTNHLIEQTKKNAKTTIMERTTSKPIYIERQPMNAIKETHWRRAAKDGEKRDAHPSTYIVNADFESAINSWYIEASVAGRVAPGDLEKKAMEIANRFHIKDFIPNKTWVEWYIGQCGLCCDRNGNPKFLFKSEFEFLKCKFSTELEFWYHQWPLTVEETMLKDDDDDDVGSTMSFEAYGQAILNWYLEVSAIGKIPLHDIKTKSDAIIKKKMPGITQLDVDVWTKRWCTKHNYVVEKVRNFDFVMWMWYTDSKKSGYITAEDLRIEAERCAHEKMGIPNFRATRNWLMRFVERNGVFLMTEGVPEFLSFTNILCMDGCNELVDVWYEYSPRSNRSPVVESVLSRGGEDVAMIVESVRKHPISVFEAEVVSWFKDVSKIGRVSPGEYLVNVLNMRNVSSPTVYSGLTWGFDHRKHCIKRLVKLHGFYLGGLDACHKFLDAECGILKWRFELAFEVWYHAYPLHVDGVPVAGCSLDTDNLILVSNYFSSLRDWFIDLRSTGDVSAEEIRVKEIEIANSLTNSEGERDLIARWCREWCSRSVAWIEKIRSLDSQVGSWYKAKSHCVGPGDLRKKTFQTARDLDMKDFIASNAWLKRFVQLHGLSYVHMGDLKYFPGFAGRSPMASWIDVSVHYNQWLKTDTGICWKALQCSS